MKPVSPRSKAFLVDLFWVLVALAHGYVALSLFDRDSSVTYAFTVIGALSIFLRHRYPWVFFLTSLPGLFISDSVVAPLVAVYTLAVRGTGNRVLIVIAALVIF